jgi:hypothetical protein
VLTSPYTSVVREAAVIPETEVLNDLASIDPITAVERAP